MATKNYTTKTASLRATKIDTNKIELKGKNILDYISENKTTILDERGTNVTENDLWGTTITTDENGVVTVSCKNVTNPNVSSGSCWNKDINLVRDNKAYKGDIDSFYGTVSNLAFFANIQTEKIVDGSMMFYGSNLAEFDSDLSSLTNSDGMFGGCNKLTYFNVASLSNLTNGYRMFYKCTALCEFRSDLSNLINGSEMFVGCELSNSFASELPSLTNGYYMLSEAALSSFSHALPALINGQGMFCRSSLSYFTSDLPSLTGGSEMFSYCTKLRTFTSNLSSLTNGSGMFANCSNLKTFTSDLSSLTNGDGMFNTCANLTSFTSDLNKLENGYGMFANCTKLTSFNSDLSNLTNGEFMFYNCTALTTFQGNLGSLLSGHTMFHGPKLDIESIEYIADGIRDLAAEELVISSDGGKTWTVDTSTEEKSNIWNKVSSGYGRAEINIGFNSELYPIGSEGESKIFALCNEMVSKGWKIYLNGSSNAYVPTDEATTTSLDGEMTTTPISYWYKPVAVEEEHASYVDANGNYFNIVGAQYIFGDDISTYGQFTSLEAAEMAMGLTKYIRPEVEEKE